MSFAMAKYAMGTRATAAAQGRREQEASTCVASGGADSAADLALHPASAAKQQEQLRACGGMVSPHLQDAQRAFLAAAQEAVVCSNARRRLQGCLPSAVSEHDAIEHHDADDDADDSSGSHATNAHAGESRGAVMGEGQEAE
jgi:hypothetical protein